MCRNFRGYKSQFLHWKTIVCSVYSKNLRFDEKRLQQISSIEVHKSTSRYHTEDIKMKSTDPNLMTLCPTLKELCLLR